MANTTRKDKLPGSVLTVDATIDSGQTTSSAIDAGGCNVVGLVFPAAFTGSTVGFEGSVDGVNYYTMVDTTGSALSLTVSTSSFVALVPSDLACARYIKVVSGASEGADRTINLAIRVL